MSTWQFLFQIIPILCFSMHLTMRQIDLELHLAFVPDHANPGKNSEIDQPSESKVIFTENLLVPKSSLSRGKEM